MVKDFYDLDAIERELRTEIATWDWPGKTEFIRKPEQLTVIQEGLFDFDSDQSVRITADGLCEMHWSFPKCFLVEGVIKRNSAKATPPTTRVGTEAT